jgi:hypothetical protein
VYLYNIFTLCSYLCREVIIIRLRSAAIGVCIYLYCIYSPLCVLELVFVVVLHDTLHLQRERTNSREYCTSTSTRPSRVAILIKNVYIYICMIAVDDDALLHDVLTAAVYFSLLHRHLIPLYIQYIYI